MKRLATTLSLTLLVLLGPLRSSIAFAAVPPTPPVIGFPTDESFETVQVAFTMSVYVQPDSVAVVWRDSNRDGLFDPSEPHWPMETLNSEGLAVVSVPLVLNAVNDNIYVHATRGGEISENVKVATVIQGTPFSAPPDAGPGAGAPFCAVGQVPAFVFGFAALSELLGPTMGQPTECEHTEAATGDAQQQTTQGLSFYRKSINTPTFTNGFEHWALTADGLVYWTGESIEPTPDAEPVQPR